MSERGWKLREQIRDALRKQLHSVVLADGILDYIWPLIQPNLAKKRTRP